MDNLSANFLQEVDLIDGGKLSNFCSLLFLRAIFFFPKFVKMNFMQKINRFTVYLDIPLWYALERTSVVNNVFFFFHIFPE